MKTKGMLLLLWLHNFALLNITLYHLRIFIPILKNASFTNVRRVRDKKHWPKDSVQKY